MNRINSSALIGNLVLLAVSVATIAASVSLMIRWNHTMGFVDAALAERFDFDSKTPAHSFEGGLDWLNIEAPLAIEDLRGKVVLVDFWTYCCINCLHVIPDLHRLEEKYEDELVVIGVHSAKFDHEKDTENIRQAILKYQIEHPVVNDANFEIFNRYGATGWPYLVLIDPNGHIIGSLSGEGHFETLDKAIGALVEMHGDEIDATPIPLRLERDKKPATVLQFPGKVLADEASRRLFIADSNHNRILIAGFDGVVSDIAGGPEAGFADGSFAEARMNHPHGMALDGERLFVADTENHAIRVIHLADRTVETIAGTGRQGYSRGGPAIETGLNSPWDVIQIERGGPLYIAMAGAHQIWSYDAESQRVEPFAGTGREDIRDHLLKRADFAQPSGLATDGTNLFVVDSEASGVRKINLELDPPLVQTLVGKDLFAFGDADGHVSQALLQHPLGAVWHDGILFIADTYNHKIKAIDLAANEIHTFAGTGEPGVGTMKAPQFFEPGGLSVADGRLYVADTNNHAIRIIDLDSRETTTLNLNLTDWKRRNLPREFDIFGEPETITLAEAAAPGATMRIHLRFEDGYHLNPLAEPMLQYRVTGAGRDFVSERLAPETDGDSVTFALRVEGVNSPQWLEANLVFYYCREDNQGQCRIGSLLIEGAMGEGGEGQSVEFRVDE